jgi:hypothetical protein
MRDTIKLTMIAAAIAGLVTMPSAFAQRNYDTKTVETIQGKVLSLEKVSRSQGQSHGIHLMLQTDKETISVHLGPARYIEKQTLKIETNDTITVTGSRVMTGGKPAIIAAEVKKGDQTLKLRDENGVPAWAGGGGAGGRR